MAVLVVLQDITASMTQECSLWHGQLWDPSTAVASVLAVVRNSPPWPLAYKPGARQQQVGVADAEGRRFLVVLNLSRFTQYVTSLMSHQMLLSISCCNSVPVH